MLAAKEYKGNSSKPNFSSEHRFKSPKTILRQALPCDSHK